MICFAITRQMVRIKAHKPLTVNKAAYREIPYLAVLIFFTQSHREFGGICDFSIYDLRLHLVILVALNDLRSNAEGRNSSDRALAVVRNCSDGTSPSCGMAV